MEDDKKKYEDALERCKKEFNFSNLAYSHEEIKQRLEHVFPELKESEDEKARNEIMEFIYWAVDRGSITEKQREKSNLWIAWLEKQGERKQNITNLISDLENYFATTTKEQQKKDWDEIKNWEEKHFNHDKYIEQKPADQVKPKFKVDDWITIDNPCQIISIEENYIVQYCDDEKTREISKKFCESHFHLWTIQDAKDGDVLYHKSPLTGIEYIVMSKGINGYGNIDSYFRYNSVDGFGTYIPSVFKAKLDDITPATKEQRDFLFQEMKEAGYEWDVEKKELKKIEQKPTEWSEKETYIEDIISCLEYLEIEDTERQYNGDRCVNPMRYKPMIDWLKSIKPQPKEEWTINNAKPGDILHTSSTSSSKTFIFKGIRNDEHGSVECFCCYDSEDGFLKGEEVLIGWKTDKYRLATPEQCIELGRIMGKAGYIFYFETNQLRKFNVSRWKPSDEQMNLLEELVEDNNQRYFYTTLRSLYQDLKKIREK